MSVALGLLLTTSLMTPATRPADQDAPTPPVQQTGSQSEPAPTPTAERRHQIGLGGFGGSGGGASFRYFANDRLGVDLNAGWSGVPTGGSRNNGSNSGTTFRLAPSAVFMLTGSHKLADLDVRPYIGGGFNYARTPSVVQTTATNQLRTSGFGVQAFGGAEFSFASVPSMAISAQVAYYSLAVQGVNLLTTSGTDFYLLFHYYMK